MKCTICGHSTLPGAMLCGPCRAALKRARYLSVQVASPPSMMRALPRRSRSQLAASVSPLGTPSAAKVLAAHAATRVPPPRSLWRPLAIALGAMAALGVVAWLGQSPARDPAPLAVPATLPATPADNGGGLPAAVNAGGIGATAALPAANSAPLPASPADAGPPRAPNTAPAQRVPAPVETRRADPTVLSAGPLGAAYEMVPEPPRPAPIAAAPAPEPAPPPPPDRWQTMRDELARCDREGGFGGFICDQRVRLASCEGFWGRVPQCPLPPENPR